MSDRKIVEIIPEKTKNALKSYENTNILFKLSIYKLTKIILEELKKGENISFEEIVSKIMNVNIYSEGGLTKDEVKYMLRVNTFDEDPEVNERLLNFTKEKILKEIVFMKSVYTGKNINYELKKESKESIKSVLITLNEILNDPNFEKNVISGYEKQLKKWKDRTIADIEIKNNEVFILNLNVDIENIIKKENLFLIESYILKSRSMTVNGEHFSFEGSESKKAINISNSYYGKLTYYLNEGQYLFFSKEEAECYEKTKIESFKGLFLNECVKVKF